MAKNWGPVTLGNEIQRIRVVFKYAFDAGLIDKPIRYGPAFKRPSKKILRLARAAKGPRMYEVGQLRQIVEAAGIPLKAMVLLGVNCGFGNADVAALPLTALDLESGWVTFPRPKTGIPRRCPLWPETIVAIRQALAKRPTAKNQENADLVFVTKYGGRWGKVTIGEPDANGKLKLTNDDPIAKEFVKLTKRLKLHRAGLAFYALRHTFETIGGDARDQVAVDHIMGHAQDDMASVYRERISDERLKAVTDHVHQWLFGAESKTAKPEEISDDSGTAATGK